MNRIILVAAGVVLSLSGIAVAGTVLLSDNFDGYALGSNASPLWAIDSGKWKVTAEGFQGADCEGQYTAVGAFAGKKEWRDYVLSLKLMMLSRGSDWRDGPWIGVRHRDDGNAYTIGFYDKLTALHKVSEGRRTGDENPLATSETTIKDNLWHDLKITVEGKRITVALDGKKIIEAADDDWNDSPPVAAGGIVLAARKWETSEGSTQVVFRDVRVEAIGEAPETMKLTREAARQSAAKTKMGILEFLKSRRDRRWTKTPRKVLAFYYTWYGRPENHGKWVHWADVKPDQHDIATSTHYPAKGAYDSHDPAIISDHIDLAKRHGIDGFICTWWGEGSFDDRAFVKVLDLAKEKDFQLTVYWETVPGKGQPKIDRAVRDLVYVLEKYGGHPAFLKVDGKPVIFIYGRIMGQVALNEWPEIVTRARERSGKDFLLIADGYQDSYACVFDGIHTYNICGWVKGKTADELAEASKQSFAEAVRMAKDRAKVSCLTIIPGYDDTKIRKPGLNAERLGGETYRVLWEQAIQADPDWVLITSWNEWHEGSEIEPSLEDGDKYITMTGKYAPMFKKTPYSRVEVPATPPSVSPEKAEALRKLYHGRIIGVLPGFKGRSVLWLVDAGVDVRELSGEDLIDPAVFNARKFPVVVYAGFEDYVQTVKQEGDADKALVRYLSEGGLLMALPAGPFPFYRNEDGENVVSAAKFGLPICGSGAFGRADAPVDSRVKGWERPPDGVTLTFTIDNKGLPSLPATAAFPTTGDLRWRPSTGAVLPEGDVYLPLAKLKDDKGNEYGDGIVYIEHKVSPPTNGKNIYVWMRMLDVLDANDMLCDLFRLAAEKMTKED